MDYIGSVKTANKEANIATQQDINQGKIVSTCTYVLTDQEHYLILCVFVL
jgi:hypothetical protein